MLGMKRILGLKARLKSPKNRRGVSMKFRLSDTLVLFVSLFLLAPKSPAFEQPSPAPLPNFDKRTDGLQAGDVVSGNQRAAVEQLRLRLPLARVDFNPVTGAPKMISAGQVSNTFNLTLVDNSVPDGHQTVTVTASAPLLANGSASIFVIDDESPPPPSNPRPGHLVVNVPANTNLMWNNGTSSSNELVINGGFETGRLTNWVLVPGVYGHFAINNGSFDPPSPDGPLPPYAGSFSALAYPTGPGIFYMYQDISIPSGTSFATLSWAHRVRNFYKSFSTSQQFQVQLCDTNNNVLAVAFTTNPGDPLLDNWIQKSYDLTLFAGQKLRVRFLVNPGMNYLDVHLDNVSVQVGSTASGELIGNGGFETGTFTNWLKQNIGGFGDFVINNGSYDPPGPEVPTPPFAGSFSAVSEQTGGGTHVIYQDIALAPGTSSAVLTWTDRIRNFSTQFATNQYF